MLKRLVRRWPLLTKVTGLLGAVILLPALARAATPVCPSNVLPTAGLTSCWVALISAPATTIPDVIDTNPLTIAGDSSFTLPGNGINCQGLTGLVGCDLTSAQSYTNPQPITLLISFSGTGGPLAQFGSTSSFAPTSQFYELFLDAQGRIAWGANNYGTLNVLENQGNTSYGDGNQHVIVASIGPAGMKIYADGAIVGKNSNVTLANYSQGSWYFGGATLTGGSPSGNTWPFAPGQVWFNGTIYYAAWWQGTQLTDAQGIAASLPGGAITPITNNYSTITGSIASLVQGTGYAYANSPVTFQTQASQNSYLPGCNSTIPIAPSQMTYTTDSLGNLPSTAQLQQGAHVNMILGTGPPVPLAIPCQASTPLFSAMTAQNTPDPVVQAVAVQGPQFAGNTVTNPANGQIGTATINSPPSFSQTQSTSATVDVGVNGNVQQVIMSGNVAIALTDFQSGAYFVLDTTENATGGFTPTFSVPAGWTLTWTGGGAQPPLPSTSPNVDNVWSFRAVSATSLVGTVSIGPASGTFPLRGNANFNNFSGFAVNQLGLSQLPPPGNFNVSATCGGTCATTYTYELTCVTGAGVETSITGPVTATNASSLSSSNFNSLAWLTNPVCVGGYNVYGRIGGALVRLANVPQPTVSTGVYIDTGAAAAPGSYMISFSGAVTFPSAVIFDLRGATWLEVNQINAGNSTSLTALAGTSTANHDLEIPIFSFYPNAGTFTNPGGFSNVQTVAASPSAQSGIWAGTKDIASAGAVPAQTGTIANSTLWATEHMLIKSATGSAITVVGAGTGTTSNPFTTTTVSDPAGTLQGDLEIVCASWSTGGPGNIVNPPAPTVPGSFVFIGSAVGYVVNSGGGVNSWTANITTCWGNYPTMSATGVPPPTVNLTGVLQQSTSLGAWEETLLGIQPWSPNTGNFPNGTGGVPIQTIVYPMPVSVYTCTVDWVPFAGCSPFPVFAIKDTTAGTVLCSSGTVTTSAFQGAVAPSSTAAIPAGDTISFLATTAGASCTAGMASITAIFKE